MRGFAARELERNDGRYEMPQALAYDVDINQVEKERLSIVHLHGPRKSPQYTRCTRLWAQLYRVIHNVVDIEQEAYA